MPGFEDQDSCSRLTRELRGMTDSGMKMMAVCFFIVGMLLISVEAQQQHSVKGSYSQPHGSQVPAFELASVSEVEYVDGPLAPLYDFLIQRRLFKFCKLLRDAEIERVLEDIGGSWTLFVPTDASFVFLPGGTLEDIQRNPQLLRDFILYHFVAGDLTASQIQNEMLVDSMQGSPLRFNIYDQILTVSGAQVLEPDLQFELGRIHIIDHPLYPIPTTDIVSYLRSNHKNMYKLLIDTGLADYISSGVFTLLVPDDVAFGFLSIELKEALTTNRSLAERVLLNHVIPGSLYTGGIVHGSQWETAAGVPIIFTVNRGLYFVNGIPIVLPDVPLTNGIVHVVNRVLLPEGIENDCHCKPSSDSNKKPPTQVSGGSRPPFAPSQRPTFGQSITTRRPSGQGFTRQTPRPFNRQTPGSHGVPAETSPASGQTIPPFSPQIPGQRPFTPSRTRQPSRPLPSPNQVTRSPLDQVASDLPPENEINGVVGPGIQTVGVPKRNEQTRPTRYPSPPRRVVTPRPQTQWTNPQRPTISQSDQHPGDNIDVNGNIPEQEIPTSATQPPVQPGRWSNRQQTSAPRYPVPGQGPHATPTTRKPYTTQSYDRNDQNITPPGIGKQPIQATEQPSWQQRNQVTTRRSTQPRTTFRPSRIPPSPPRRPVQPGIDGNFESNRQRPNCRPRSDRVTPFNQNMPLCPETSPSDCQQMPFNARDNRPLCPSEISKPECRNPGEPFDPSDNRPLCPVPTPGQDCRIPGQQTYAGDRRPICSTTTLPQTGCRDPSEPPNPLDSRPVCRINDPNLITTPAQDMNPQQGCRRPDEPTSPQDLRPLCPSDIQQQDCRPLLERPKPGDRRPVCKINNQSVQRPAPAYDTVKGGRQPETASEQQPSPQQNVRPPVSQTTRRQSWRTTQIPTTRRQSWRTTTQFPTTRRQSWQSTTQSHQDSFTETNIPDQQIVGKQPQTSGSLSPLSPPPQAPSRTFQSRPQTSLQQPQRGSVSQPQLGSYPSRPGTSSIPSQPQTGSYPSVNQGSRYPTQPQTPSSGHVQSAPNTGSYPTGPQSGAYPSPQHPNSQSPYPVAPQQGISQSPSPRDPPIGSHPSVAECVRCPNQQGTQSGIPGSSNIGSNQPFSPQRRPIGGHQGTSFTTSPGRGSSTPRVPISVTGTSTTPGEDSRRSLYEIVEDPSLLIRGRPVKLNKIFTLFHKAGIQDVLTGPGPTTVFLPSDDAFATLPAGVIEQLEENPDLLRQVLLYHVTNSEILPSSEGESFTVPSLGGRQLVITMLNGGRLILISGAKAVAVTRANNGIFYVINQLLYPLPHDNIVNAIQSRPDLSTLAWMLPASGLTDMLQGQVPFTLLAPTDTAFALLPPAVYDELTRNTTALHELLLNHIVEGAHYGREFLTGGTFPNARGGKLRFQVVSYGYQVNDINIKTPEIVTGTGVIHLIDQVLLDDSDLQFFNTIENSVTGLDVSPGSDTQEPPVGSLQPISGQASPPGHRTSIRQSPTGHRIPPGQSPVSGLQPSVQNPPLGTRPTHGQQQPVGQRSPVNQPQTAGQTPFRGQRPSSTQPQTLGQSFHGGQRPQAPVQPAPVGQRLPVTQPQNAGLQPQSGQRPSNTYPNVQRQPGNQGHNVNPSQVSGQAHNVAEMAKSMGLNRFSNWISNTGLLEKIHDGGVYTIFAPTDDAVNALPQDMSYSLESNPEEVKSLLMYHIIPQRINLNSVTNEETASTLLQGKAIRFNVYENVHPDCKQLVTVSGTPIGEALATMGSVQVIPVSQVLYQPSGNLLKIIEASPILQQLSEAVRTARLTWVLSGNGPITFFAPSDTAFQSLTEEQRKSLIEDKNAFSDLLKRHMVRGTVFSSAVQEDLEKKSENGQPLKLSLHEGVMTVNSIPVAYSDITAINGVLHVIDQFL